MFINYTVSFFQPVRDIARIFAELQSAQAAAERVISLLETEPDIVDSPEVVAQYGDNFHPKTENWPKLIGDIAFEDVTFRYKEGEKVLEHFNLHIQHGQTIALVGETGSGKSTIVNLLCRFYDLRSGSITLTDESGVKHDITDVTLHSLRSQMGIMLQDSFIFSGTILDNIRYGRLDATDDEVRQAAAVVRADDFIREMPQGYKTTVNERGGSLSQGQKQLIAFARTLLSDPRILILDEATSSIDTKTEKLLQDGIQALLKGRTSFIIAHRLSTIKNCDRILYIGNQGIMEAGSHDELMAKRGAYYELYTAQARDQGMGE